MLVSHRYRFIYTKTAKTAGTSVESYFEQFCMPGGEWTFGHERDEYVSASGIIGFRGAARPANCAWWNHMPAVLIRQGVGEKVWAGYFKFCVIRNPYDKVVSAYYYSRASDDRTGTDVQSEFTDLDHERAQFETWIQSARLPIDRDKYLIDDKFCLDDVVRYENLAMDLERISIRIGVPWDPGSLPFLKSGFRPKNGRVQTLYTEKARKVVEDAFSFELGFFGYSFPTGS